MTQRSDVELLTLVHQSDEQASVELVKRHGRYLFGIARALVRDEQEAEDVVQEAFMAACTGRYRGDASVRTWLVSIVIRQAALVRRKRRPWLRLRHPPPEGADPAGFGSDAVRAADARMDLTRMLEQLSVEHRQVLVLRELEGCSYQEIARLLDISQGTVESRLHRAREQLRRRYAGQEPNR